MNSVHVSCYQSQPPAWFAQVEPFTRWVLRYLNLQNWEISLVFAHPVLSQQLNLRYRHKDYPTDILSFPAQPEPPYGEPPGGELLICLEVIAVNAQDFCVSYQDELNRTLIHGILHLAGWNHDEQEPEGEMLLMQEAILEQAHQQEECIHVTVA